MNQGYLNCQELQRFLERQWQKLRGIISQDPSYTSQELGTSETSTLLEDSSSNEEQASSYTRNNRRPAMWKDSMDVIIEESNVTDIVSVIDTTCENLTSLLDAGHGYRRYYVQLLEALVKLLTTLKDVEKQEPDMLKGSGIFGQLKVSLSTTYALVEKVSARQKLLIFIFKFRPLACTASDPVPHELKEQVTETKELLKEVVRSLEIYYQSYNPLQVSPFGGGPSRAHDGYGVNKLTVAANHHRSLLLQGDKITFFFRDSDINVVYTVETWLNNPSSLFHRAKRLSASVESSSGRLFNISVPGYPNKEVDLHNRTALIVSGIEQAQVRSLLPLKDPDISVDNRRTFGSLLQHGVHDSGQPHQKYAGELLVHSKPKYQQYRGEIVMSNMVLKLDCIGETHEVRKLSVEGKKHKTKVWYKCCVEVTGEVLAIYRQKRRNRNPGRRDEGVFHTLGLGNHPELRDIIICSFVAMGVNSFL